VKIKLFVWSPFDLRAGPAEFGMTNSSGASSHQHGPAIHVEDLAGDEAGMRSTQEQDGGGDLLGRGDSEVSWRQASVFSDPGQHAWPDLNVGMERPNVIRKLRSAVPKFDVGAVWETGYQPMESSAL
jgi:hypothetical protein